MSTLRTLARGIAKGKMKNHGFAKFCKHGYYGKPFEKTRTDSVFAKQWRNILKEDKLK